MTDKNGFPRISFNLPNALLITTALSLFTPSSAFANKYIESAREYIDSNETSAAIIELKNAVKEQPKEGLPRFLLGQIYLDSGSYANAEKELSRALKFGYSSEEVLPLLAQALFSQKKLGDVLLLLDEFDTPESKLPDNFLAIAAMTELRQGNLEAAKRLLERTEEKATYTYLAEAVTLSINDSPSEALSMVDQAIVHNAQNSDAWLLKGNLELLQKDYSNAINSYKNASKYAPNAIEPHFLIAIAQVENEEYETAEPTIDRLLQISEQSPSVNGLKAMVTFSRQDYQAAKIYADRAINNGSENLRVLIISGISSFQLGQLEQSRITLESTIPQLENNHPIVRIYTITLLQLGSIDKAIEILNHYQIDSDDDRQFISQISKELAKVGRTKEALALAMKASTKDATQSDPLLGLIKLANNDASGLQDLQAVLQENPDSRETKQAIASYYINNKELNKAKLIADSWLNAEPNNIDALMLKGVIERKQGEMQQAKATFNKVINQNADHPRALLGLADIAIREQHTEKALKLTRQARELLPNNYTIIKQYIELHQRAGTLDLVITEFDQQLEQAPFDPHLKWSKANALIFKGERKEAINLLESISVEVRDATIFELLANLYLSLDNKIDAQKNYRAWLEIVPYNPTAYMRNIQLANQMDNNVEALNLIKKANRMFPDDSRFNLMKIGILIASERLIEAQNTYNALDEQVKMTPIALQLQGRIHLADRQFDDAISTYQQKFEALPTVASALELTSVYTLAEQPESGIEFLQKVIAEHPNQSKYLEFKLAELQMQADPQSAMRQYESILQQFPNNVPALNNLAWLYLEDKQINRACDLAAKAYDIAQRSIEVTDTYGVCLLKKGETKKAVELLARANQMKSDDPQIAVHYAESLLLDNQLEKAKSVVGSIQTEDPSLVVNINKLTAQINNASR